MALSIGDRRLGAILLEQGYVNDLDLQRALDKHAEVGGRLADILIDGGMVGEKRIARAVEEALGIPLVNLGALVPDRQALASVKAQVALSSLAFPFALEGDTLRVAFVDPLNNLNLETVEDASGLNVELYQALREQVQWAIANFYPELGLPVGELADAPDEAVSLLGQQLVSRGLISEEQLLRALEQQGQSGEALGTVLTAQGSISEDQLYETLAEQSDTVFVRNPRDYDPPDELLGLLLRADALRLSAVPIGEQEDTVLVIGSDPRRGPDIEGLMGRPVRLLLGRPRDVEALIERCYPQRGRLGEQMVQQGTLSRTQLREALQVQARTGKVKPLGGVIVEMGFAESFEIDAALQKQTAGGGRLEDTLVQSGKLSPEMLARSLAAQLGYEFLDPVQSPPDPQVALLIPESTARRYSV
ncbi:MAG: type II/IV secretion system protein, partial [Deinococcus sp.]